MGLVETRYGLLRVPEGPDDVIGRFLRRYGEWAWDESRFVAGTLPDSGARVLDVGAFVGTFGLGTALQGRLGFLCAVEANGAVAPLLSDNIKRNCPVPAVVVEALVGWPGLEATEGRSKPGNIGSMSFAVAQAGGDQGAVAPPPPRVVTLAGLRAEHGDFDLVKLDVEGMELDILRGDADHLAQGTTSLWVECNEDPRSLAVAELLLSWGLDLHYFAFPAHNPDNLRGDPVPIFPFAYEAGLLAAPRVAPVLDEVLRSHRCILRPVTCLDDVKNALWRTPRWGAPEWVGARPEELAALATHWVLGEGYETYLQTGSPEGPSVGEGSNHPLERIREGLRSAEALARDRLALLEAERERVVLAETALATASAQALDRLAELGAERERTAAAAARAADLELRAHQLEARASAAEGRAAAVESSTIWRLSAALRRFLGARPRLRAALRRVVGAFAALLGRRV